MNIEKVFPLIEHIWNNDTESYVPALFGGLTKRELFAAIAMQGMVTAITQLQASGIILHRPQDVAEISKVYADALLAELAK